MARPVEFMISGRQSSYTYVIQGEEVNVVRAEITLRGKDIAKTRLSSKDEATRWVREKIQTLVGAE